jgi:beta-xylosidase
MTAEGGSVLNHSVTIARSANISGPYESFAANPVLTNRNTSEYFQNVGHADLFQDQRSQWWSSAWLGAQGRTYPMGREMVLTPVIWNKGCWPAARGTESGWYLPSSTDIPGDGPYADGPDVVDFKPNSTISRDFF